MCVTHEQNWSNQQGSFFLSKGWSGNTVRQDGLFLLLLMEAVTANQPTGHDSTV